MAIKDFFQRDHREIDGLYRAALEQAKSGATEAALRTYDQYERFLERHIVWEETLLFPAFEEATEFKEGGPTQVMREEHRRIRAFKAELRAHLATLKGPAPPTHPLWEASRALVEVLGDHNRKEEAILYPMCDRSLSPFLREKILRQVEEEKGEPAPARARTDCC